MGSERLGLSASRYAFLQRTIDVVINAAGSTNHTYSYAYYRKESISSFLELVGFCLTDRYKTLHNVSSRELAEYFGLRHVSWDEFRRALDRQYGMRLWPSDWRRPFMSFYYRLKRGLFAKALFRPDLPRVVERVSAASRAGDRQASYGRSGKASAAGLPIKRLK